MKQELVDKVFDAATDSIECEQRYGMTEPLVTFKSSSGIGMIRNIYIDDENDLIMSAAPKNDDYSNAKVIEIYDILDFFEENEVHDIFVKTSNGLEKVVDVAHKYMGVNEDDEGYNFVELVCEECL